MPSPYGSMMAYQRWMTGRRKVAGRRASVFEILRQEVFLLERVASRILAVFIKRQLRPGEPLSSDRDLAAQSGVSRTVIREVVGSLAGRVVLKVRAGRGLGVAAVDHSALPEPMNLFLRARPTLDNAKVRGSGRWLRCDLWIRARRSLALTLA